MKENPQTVIAFWREAGAQRWFAHDPAFDQAIADRFGETHVEAARGLLAEWEETAAGALALLIVTDQFPRNMHRGSAHAFATDALARNVAERALARGFDQQTDSQMRPFFYLPLQHHEDPDFQARAVALYQRLAAETGDDQGLRYAHLHAELIARFGRFPHRNAVMGRISTPEETAYLASGGFAG